MGFVDIEPLHPVWRPFLKLLGLLTNNLPSIFDFSFRRRSNRRKTPKIGSIFEQNVKTLHFVNIEPLHPVWCPFLKLLGLLTNNLPSIFDFSFRRRSNRRKTPKIGSIFEQNVKTLHFVDIESL